MKLIWIFIFLYLATMVSAGTEDVMFKLKLEYVQTDSVTNCVNETIVVGNITTIRENCSTIINGQIRLTGGEDETHIGITENLLDIISGKIYTGYKTADLGNLSDITGINDKLEAYTICTSRLNDCIISNSDVSAKLILLEEDSGLKTNFTVCSTDLIKLNADLDIKQNDIKTKTEKIKSLESSKIMWILLGGIIGALLIGVGIPKMRGKDTPDQPSGRDFPPNPGY